MILSENKPAINLDITFSCEKQSGDNCARPYFRGKFAHVNDDDFFRPFCFCKCQKMPTLVSGREVREKVAIFIIHCIRCIIFFVVFRKYVPYVVGHRTTPSTQKLMRP